MNIIHYIIDLLKACKERLEKSVFIILLFLILARIISVILYYNGIPPNIFHSLGLTPNISPDQFEYFRVALSFSKFEFTTTQYPIGLPLLLVPFIYIFHADALSDIFMPVSIFNSIFLYCLSIPLIYGIANRITRSNKISLLASALWVLFPYNLSSKNMWVYVLSEPPMIFVMLLAVYLYLRGRENESLKYPLFIGMLTAFDVMFRIPSSLFVLFFALMYAFERKFKHCIIFLASTLVFLTPQFVYNSIAYQTVATTGYTTGSSAIRYFSIDYVVPFFDQILYNNWLYSLFGLLAISTIGILYLFIVCKDKFKVFFLASWLYSFFAAYSVMRWCLADVSRYLMPSYPAAVICIASFVVVGFNSLTAIILSVFKGERKTKISRDFIIVIIPLLFLSFAGIVSPNILSERYTYNLNNAENEAIEYSGWYVTSNGLWLKPNTSGVLVYEIITKGYPYVYLYPISFYNPGTNRLEISTDSGGTFEVISENKSMSGKRLNITKYVKDKPSFLLKFSANNFENDEKMVLANICICRLRYIQ